MPRQSSPFFLTCGDRHKKICGRQKNRPTGDLCCVCHTRQLTRSRRSPRAPGGAAAPQSRNDRSPARRSRLRRDRCRRREKDRPGSPPRLQHRSAGGAPAAWNVRSLRPGSPATRRASCCTSTSPLVRGRQRRSATGRSCAWRWQAGTTPSWRTRFHLSSKHISRLVAGALRDRFGLAYDMERLPIIPRSSARVLDRGAV
jgi:hypothetical protein